MTPAQPRHPLEVLRELVGDWDRERQRHYFAPGCRPLRDTKGHYTYEVLGRCIEQVLAVITQMETQESALRAQAEAEAAVRSENAVLRAFVVAFADEDGCGCGYGRELLDAYGAAYELMWPETALAQAGGES